MCWGSLFKKSFIQRQKGFQFRSVSSLLISQLGMMELNAKLKSTDSILNYESGLSRWLRAVGRDGVICGSVDVGQARGNVGLNVLAYQPIHAIHDHRYKGHRSVIFHPVMAEVLGTGIMVAVLRQMGTLARWTLPGCPFGPGALLFFCPAGLTVTGVSGGRGADYALMVSVVCAQPVCCPV